MDVTDKKDIVTNLRTQQKLTLTHSLNLAAIPTYYIPCMRCILLISLLILALTQLLISHCLQYSCTISSSSLISMCFGKTKTLKTLRNCCHNDNTQELGFNIDDSCDYIEPEQLSTKESNRASLKVIEINCRGMKSKLDNLEELLVQINEPDLALLSETWLQEGEERFIDIKGYKYKGVA